MDAENAEDFRHMVVQLQQSAVVAGGRASTAGRGGAMPVPRLTKELAQKYAKDNIIIGAYCNRGWFLDCSAMLLPLVMCMLRDKHGNTLTTIVHHHATLS